MPCPFKYAESICTLVKHARKLRKVPEKTAKEVLNMTDSTGEATRHKTSVTTFLWVFPKLLLSDIYILLLMLLYSSGDIKT